MEKTIAGKTVQVNEEGYLTDLSQWDRDIAAAFAAEEEVGPLNERHWAIIEYLQNQHRQEARLSIRSIGKSGVTDIKEFYQLFPNGPLKKAARIAGIPKPASCI